MKKRFLASLSALALTLSLTPVTALAAGLSPIRDSIVFSDVPQDWSLPYIDRCYRLGLMSGSGVGLFDPSGTISVAEAVMATLRLAELYAGEDGVISQEGAHWYDNAVAQAQAQGILAPGQFDSYTRPATRAELAGLLGGALPEEAYAPRNRVDTLPDVDSATPYSEDIFRLYRAGVLSGSDSSGTFHPERSITRAEVSALLCRLAQPDTRLDFVTAPAAAAPIHTTDRVLYINGIPCYGVVEIGGKYYYPGVLLQNQNMIPDDFINFSIDPECFYLSLYDDGEGEVFWANRPGTVPAAGLTMGIAALSDKPLVLRGREISNAVYTLDGRYPMFSLEAAGAAEVNGSFYLDTVHSVLSLELSYEDDLTAAPGAALGRATPRETTVAIHDYLVNTLTYNPWHTPPKDMPREEIDAARRHYRSFEDTWHLPNNLTLASGYGICQNYADLFQLLCTQNGIPCLQQYGQGGAEYHVWNMAYVDGQWLYVDCTFDDPPSMTPVLDHDYCLVGPEQMVKTHHWKAADYPMLEEYDPAWEAYDPMHITTPEMFRRCLVAQVKLGRTTITMHPETPEAYGGFACIMQYPGAWRSLLGEHDEVNDIYTFHITYKEPQS